MATLSNVLAEQKATSEEDGYIDLDVHHKRHKSM